MSKYKLTVEADIDLDDIWEYTNSQWGQNQARKYLSKLEKSFITLAENPNIGIRRYELAGSPMSHHCGRHVIFYRIANKTIEIVRVLHDSMDFPYHFN